MIPVTIGREPWYLIIFLIQYAVGLSILTGMGWSNWFGGIEKVDVMRLAAPLIIMATANTILIVEGVPMLAERYLKRRYQEGRQENQKEWEDWNERRLQAERENRPFTDPPPKLESAERK